MNLKFTKQNIQELVEFALVILVVFSLIQVAKMESLDQALKMIQSAQITEVPAGEDFSITVGYKNTGATLWTREGLDKVEIKIIPPYDRVSDFMSDKWLDQITVGQMTDEECLPGQIAYFTLNFKAPDSVNTYSEQFNLVKNDLNIIEGGDFELSVNVIANEPEVPEIQTEIKEEEDLVSEPESEKKIGLPVVLPTLKETEELDIDEICKRFDIDSVDATYFDRFINYCLGGRDIKNSYADNSINFNHNVMEDEAYLLWRRQQQH